MVNINTHQLSTKLHHFFNCNAAWSSFQDPDRSWHYSSRNQSRSSSRVQSQAASATVTPVASPKTTTKRTHKH